MMERSARYARVPLKGAYAGIPVRAEGGLTIPPYSVVEVSQTEVSDETLVCVVRHFNPYYSGYANTQETTILVTGAMTLSTEDGGVLDRWGLAYTGIDTPVIVTSDVTTTGKNAGPDPQGATYGIVEGYPGFIILGAATPTGTAYALRQMRMSMCKGTLVRDLGWSDVGAQINNIIGLSGLAPYSLSFPTEELTAVNTLKLSGVAGNNVITAWNEGEMQWELLAVERGQNF